MQIPSHSAHTIYHRENTRLRLRQRMETYWPDVDVKVAEETDDSWENKMKHIEKKYKPVEWKLLKGAFNGGDHYLGAAKIMAPISRAFAETSFKMITLL